MRRRRERIYISGAISGRPYREVKARFDRAERILATFYPKAKIINPMRNPFPRGTKWQWHMLLDLFRLSRCTQMYQLTGWNESYGARIEYQWAKKLGIEILFEWRWN